MKNDQLIKTHEDLDKTISDTAAKLAENDPEMDASVERDISIIMACSALAQDHLPEPAVTTQDVTAIGNGALRGWVKGVRRTVKQAVTEAPAGKKSQPMFIHLLQMASELAYEFDEKLSSEIDKEIEEVDLLDEPGEGPNESSPNEESPPAKRQAHLEEMGKSWFDMPDDMQDFLDKKIVTEADRIKINGWKLFDRGRLAIYFKDGSDSIFFFDREDP